MKRRAAIGAVATALTLLAAMPVAAEPRRHHDRGRPGLVLPLEDLDPPVVYDPYVPPLLLAPETRPEDEPPSLSVPSPVPGRGPGPGLAPYPQGFVLDVPVTPDAEPAAPPGPLTRFRQIADALAACWRPPATFGGGPWRQVTLRVSFKRDGSINGMPRIPFVEEGLTADARSDLTRSLMAALDRCTPLSFSHGLGNAVAGQIFALRFIKQDDQK